MQKPLAIQVGSRHAEKGTQHTGNIFQCSDICTRWLNPAHNNLTWQQTYHLLYFQQFQVLLTLFSKSFSHFPQGTCLLSFPTQQFTLGEVYHQFCTPLPRSTTLKNTPRIKDCTWQTRVSLSLLLFFKSAACTLPLAMQLKHANQNQRFGLAGWAIPCSFAITTGVLVSLFFSAYLYA